MEDIFSDNELDIFSDKKMLENLNEVQKEAVINTEGRIRIVAGAGSGKTRVIAHRYAHLVNDIGINPATILCTTFTNKAAKEMSKRISKLLAEEETNDFVCTIHGFCVKFLREEINRIGFPSTFNILDNEDQKLLAKQVKEELNISSEEKTIKRILKDISNYKSSKTTEYVKNNFLPDSHITEEQKKDPMCRYLSKQMKTFSLDFKDLIYVTLYILENYIEAKDKWSKKINYIMIDEAQDLSRSQWEIMEILASESHNLFIVGDPDQAIYQWRGANPKLFIDFQNDKTIVLNQNYRSTPNILNAANSIIKNNTNRYKKDLYTTRQYSQDIIHFHGENEDEEMDWVTNQMLNIINKTSAKLSDFAVLYRANYISRNIEQFLIQKGIAYQIWGGFRFFEREEIKDTLAYLKLIVSNDNLAFLRIINKPTRKLGEKFVEKIKDIASKEDISLYEALKRHITDKELKYYQNNALSFINFIEEMRDLESLLSISDLVDYILEKSGLKKQIRISGDEERIENLNELLTSIKDYEEKNKNDEINIKTYLQDIALYTNADYRKNKNTVKLMTIHQSKGLEFPYVFIINVSEGIIPSLRHIRESGINGLEEERRLMYVAITRAEKAAFITESEGFDHSSSLSKYPSRFILEIDENYLITEGKIPEDFWEKAQHNIDYSNIILNNIEQRKSLINEFKDEELNIGQQIFHETFGNGEIIEIIRPGQVFKIKFNNCERTLSRYVLKHITITKP